MLKAEIALHDLSHQPEWREGALTIGGSRIEPYAHSALETLFAHTEGQWIFVVRERHTSMSLHANVIDGPLDAQHFAELHRACLMWPLDYVMIEVAKAGHRIKIRAGMYGAAPLYCRAKTSALTLSWDLADFLAGPVSIDLDIASRFLALGSIYSAQHICSGITMLTERAMLFAEPGKAHYHYPAAIDTSAQSPEPLDDAEADEAFGKILHGIVSSRPTSSGRIATELSGGMDSATVACALTKAYGVVASKGILLDGDERKSQVARRTKIVERLRLIDETVDIDAHLPTLDLQPGETRVYPHAELYLEAFDSLWGKARAQGCALLFTGVGGDELFPTYQSETTRHTDTSGELVEQARYHATGLLTSRAQAAVDSSRLFDAPAGPIPVSSLLAGTCQAPHLLRHGLWPVNPLSDPRLVAFCYRLPPASRHRRAVMQRYLAASLGADVFPPNYAKETFSAVLPALISRQEQSLASQLRECALADLGLVDHGAVLALLREVAATRSDAPAAPLISFLWLERFVRQLA